jgi:hypothetical protein
MSEKTYDSRCADLAEHFLADISMTPEERTQRVASLARAIQEAVEDWISDEDLD